jgi:iron complex outermembrane receptor protein
MKTKLAVLALCLAASRVLAAEPAAEQRGLSEKEFLGEVPIVLSVSRLPQPLNEAPGAVSIIDRDMIRRSGAREVADVLRLVPGFQTTEARGGNPVAVYHGTFFENSNRIQVLIDGRSVYSPFYTGTSSIGMRTVALEDIDRIEVLRGSNSATYGARAVLGVINIITRDPAETRGAAAKINAGQRDLLDGTARIGWGGESASFRLTADSRGDAGFSASDRNRLNGVNFRGDLRTSAKDSIELRAGASDQRWSDGFADTPDSPPRTRRYYGGYLQADWRHSRSSEEEFKLSYSHNEERYRDRYEAIIPTVPAFAVDYGGQGRVDSLEFNHRFSASPALRLSWGGEWRVESVVSAPLYNSAARISTRFARLNANVEWRLHPKLLLNAGAMLEDNSAAGSDVLPRAMVNWLVAPNHTLRAGASQAHRPPAIFERQADQRFAIPGTGYLQNWLATPGLRAEKLDAVELGYYGELRPLRLVLDVRAYEERIKDFIRIERWTAPLGAGALNGAGPSFVNGRTLRMRGLEFQATWRPFASTQIVASQSFVNADFPTDGEFLSVPRSTTSLAWFQRLPQDWDFALLYSHAGAMTWSGTGNMLEAHDRIDLRLARKFRINGAPAEAAIVAQNVSGAYQEYLPRLEFGSRIFGTLRVAFE